MKLEEMNWNNYPSDCILEDVAIFGVMPVLAMLKVLEGETEPELTKDEKQALIIEALRKTEELDVCLRRLDVERRFPEETTASDAQD